MRLFIYLPMHRSIFQCIYLSVHVNAHLCIYRSLRLSTHQSNYAFIYLFMYLISNIYLSIFHLSVYSSNIHPSICPFVYSSHIHPLIWPSIYASVYARKESKRYSPVQDVIIATPTELGEKNGQAVRSLGSCRSGPTFSVSEPKQQQSLFLLCLPGYKAT